MAVLGERGERKNPRLREKRKVPLTESYKEEKKLALKNKTKGRVRVQDLPHWEYLIEKIKTKEARKGEYRPVSGTRGTGRHSRKSGALLLIGGTYISGGAEEGGTTQQSS